MVEGGRSRSRAVLVAVGSVVALVIVAAIGLAVRTALHKAAPAAAPQPVGWEVDACVRQVDGPTAIPSGTDAASRVALLGWQTFEPVPCTDPRAESKIIALGAPFDALIPAKPFDPGCPEDTDAAYRPTGKLPFQKRVACVRNLKAPHPGDPGAGGGTNIIAGDCVFIVGMLDNGYEELPCDGPQGWFAQVVAVAPAPASCPARVTVSRLTYGATSFLCLGQGRGGTIAKPGDCVTEMGSTLAPIAHTACTASTRKLSSLVDKGKSCPSGTKPRWSPGYDRNLCLR